MTGIIQIAPDGFPVLSGALGTTADAAATSDAATATLIALMKRLLGKFPALQAGAIPVTNTNAAINTAGACVGSIYSASATSGTALAANANAKRRMIYNNSNILVTLGFTATVTATTGIPLPPGNLWLETPDSGFLHTGIFSAITASTAQLLIFEWS